MIQTLHRIEPLITQEDDIPHAQAKLKNFSSLHLTEGLYMLQFRKSEEETCCIRKKESSLHLFLRLYFLQMMSTIYHLKIYTVNYPLPKKIVPPLHQKHKNPKPNTKQNFKFLECRVVAVLEWCSMQETKMYL